MIRRDEVPPMVRLRESEDVEPRMRSCGLLMTNQKVEATLYGGAEMEDY